MVLQINSEHLNAITAQAEHTYPEECCGLMLGILDRATPETTRRVVELWPTQNAWTPDLAAATGMPDPTGTLDSSRTDRYWIDPKDLLAAQKSARDRNLDIVGVYHSHPNHPAVPSECDRTYAWPQYSYLIVSVQQGKAKDCHSWALDDRHQFQPEEILTLEFQVWVDDSPSPTANS